MPEWRFRKRFTRALGSLGWNVGSFNFAVSGAEAKQVTPSYWGVDSAVNCGRWASVTTARIYIEGGTAMLADLHLSERQVEELRRPKLGFCRMWARERGPSLRPARGVAGRRRKVLPAITLGARCVNRLAGHA